ncbi:lysine decarboxylase [Gracilibacillus halophilus YIM-C55.5]|uniref:Lysine decarboxylase n=1 Tax=Gracilibacillus halophilus YIM-C55.5 TaxID=1308866 RepID=N4WSH8_9BACI|nr:lysine decarboxylase [Gracilibacillus halophilus]ENH96106.1 lysine decarboxylase [Gracilibacillus halophilus YIM-C55.5]
MMKKQQVTPLFDRLQDFAQQHYDSFHVPGHKNGRIVAHKGQDFFDQLLPLDVTELSGLDDLHAAQGVIQDAQRLAAEWFGATSSYFLVNGSTVGNLAMILATVTEGDQVFIQRNCHKSLIHGIELANAQPIFLSPDYDEAVERYTAPSLETIQLAFQQYPEVKALILTYPDYFGRTYDIKSMINYAHSYQVPVLIDEAHGCHFSLPFVPSDSALDCGADIVVQSAHKMTPALTMGAFLHIQSEQISSRDIEAYLQMLQSSSPSYPIMASLDLARHYLATYSKQHWHQLMAFIHEITTCFQDSPHWKVIAHGEKDDPLKLTIAINSRLSVSTVAHVFEQEGIFPEMIDDNQLLFVFGLTPHVDVDNFSRKLESIHQQLNSSIKHAKIEEKRMPQLVSKIDTLQLSYRDMKRRTKRWIRWEEAIHHIAAEAIIPYPPGIPFIIKGEEITRDHVDWIQHIFSYHAEVQPAHREKGLYIYM